MSKTYLFTNDHKEIYRIHSRRFKGIPSGYPKPKDITENLSIHSFPKPNLDETASMGCSMVVHQLNRTPHYPWYWLTQELANDLVKTSSPQEIPDQISLPKAGVIVLPDGTVPTGTGEILAIAYTLFEPNETTKVPILYPNRVIEELEVSFARKDCYNLAWFGIEVTTYCLGGVIGLIPDKGQGCLRVNDEGFDALMDEEAELKEADCCQSILLSTLIYSDQVESIPDSSQLGRLGFSKPSNTKPDKQKPVFIGKEYKSVSRTYRGGTHASPRIHWRRGHWKRVATGKGGTGREWRYIKPTLVNKES